MNIKDENFRIDFIQWAEIRFPDLDIGRAKDGALTGEFKEPAESLYIAWRGGYRAGQKEAEGKRSSGALKSSGPLPDLMDQQTLAQYLGKSIAWCERARWAGEGPQFIKIGRHVRYRSKDVTDWIDENVRSITDKE